MSERSANSMDVNEVINDKVFNAINGVTNVHLVSNTAQWESQLIFYVNGQRVQTDGVDLRTTLAYFLRDRLKLTGTKIGCNEGGCGACTVMVSDQDPVTDQIRHYSVNSCLLPVCSVFGKAVTTIEGVGNHKRLHAIQDRLARAHGSQCGFCTPGFVMAMYALLRNEPKPTTEQIDIALQGNLCRCTGYRPILEAFYSLSNSSGKIANAIEQPCGMGEKCCKMTGRTEATKLTDFDGCKQPEVDEEFIFPPELKVMQFHRKGLKLTFGDHLWYQPVTLHHLLELKRDVPNSRIVAGNSEAGVELKFFFIDSPIMINVRQVPEMRESFIDDDRGVFIGMGYSLSETDQFLQKYIEQLPEWKTGVLVSVRQMLHWFAGIHVRNVATIAGNIMTASPISDLNPIWLACEAKIIVRSSARGQHIIPINEDFFTGYRKTIVKPDEVICGIWIPFTDQNQCFYAYKQSQRRDDDIAIVTGAFMASVDPNGHRITKFKCAFGGVAAITKVAICTSKMMIGRVWNADLLEFGIAQLNSEFRIAAGAPGGMERYRETLVLSLFMKFLIDASNRLGLPIGTELTESRIHFEETIPTLIASQIHQTVPESQCETDPVGRPLMHHSGIKHTTGEANYCDDYCPANALSMVLLLAPIAKGILNGVDTSAALALDGVIAYIDHRDLRPGAAIGFGFDTPIFVDKQISYHCQPIGGIIAIDHETARRAANLVKIDCTPEKPILTIEDAIEHSSYINERPEVLHSALSGTGNTKQVPIDWSTSDQIIEGSVKIGGQEHFYLETSSFIANPLETDEIELIASTQCVSDVQEYVAHALNIPLHKVVVRVKRIGGGFGGKESSSSIFAVPVAVAAMKLRRSVKLTAERFDDMAITGTRHPFRADYRAGIGKNGKIEQLQFNFYGNGGHSLDLSIAVLHRTLTHADNVYLFENMSAIGRACRTNMASSTAFRGFGAPQAMFACETMMLHVAQHLGQDVDQFREMHLYNEGDHTPFGMALRQCNIRRCWNECMQMSNYTERKKAVNHFNQHNRFIKRGIYLTPTKFGIAFGLHSMNQAGALVNIYKDGTVLITHGGMEMGQGLHTKILQIASRCLGIDVSKIYISETATDKVPNASPTAASVGSDLNGLAVMDACKRIIDRLMPVKRQNPGAAWEEIVTIAYDQRISLFSTGFGTVFHKPVDFKSGKGSGLYSYCVYGVACSEVEIDCLTGDHHLIRTDIVMDVGDSLNPAVDIGQIEGAFIQGYGLFTMEELKIRPDGTRLTRGPGTYKIPSADDIPRQFHVALLKGSSNRMAIFSSKAVGEPPLFLGASTFFAIREAIAAYRAQSGHHDYFRLDSPATPERVRMACLDEITQIINPLPDKSQYTQWTVEL